MVTGSYILALERYRRRAERWKKAAKWWREQAYNSAAWDEAGWNLVIDLETENERLREKLDAFEKALEREVRRTMSEDTKEVFEQNERLREALKWFWGRCGVRDCRAISKQVNHGFCWKCRKIVKALEADDD